MPLQQLSIYPLMFKTILKTFEKTRAGYPSKYLRLKGLFCCQVQTSLGFIKRFVHVLSYKKFFGGINEIFVEISHNS